MRGVTSNGMLCSPKELGLADDHAGLMILSRPGAGKAAGVELGMPLAEHLGIAPDVVFDLAVEANRPDCLSILGVARDLAAHYGLPLEVPEPRLAEVLPRRAGWHRSASRQANCAFASRAGCSPESRSCRPRLRSSAASPSPGCARSTVPSTLRTT